MIRPFAGIATQRSTAFEPICISEHEAGLFLQGATKPKPEKMFPATGVPAKCREEVRDDSRQRRKKHKKARGLYRAA